MQQKSVLHVMAVGFLVLLVCAGCVSQQPHHRGGSANSGSSISIPPGYAFHQGVRWNFKVCQAACAKAKEEKLTCVCIGMGTDGSLYAIKEGSFPVKVDEKLDLHDGVMLVGAWKDPVRVAGVELSYGEYAVRTAGEFVKSPELLKTNAPK